MIKTSKLVPLSCWTFGEYDIVERELEVVHAHGTSEMNEYPLKTMSFGAEKWNFWRIWSNTFCTNDNTPYISPISMQKTLIIDSTKTQLFFFIQEKVTTRPLSSPFYPFHVLSQTSIIC